MSHLSQIQVSPLFCFHLGCHLEYINLLNDDRVASLGFFKGNVWYMNFSKEKNFRRYIQVLSDISLFLPDYYVSASYPLIVSEKIFEYFFEQLPFMSHCQPIKLCDLDKSHMTKRRGLLNKHHCISFKYPKWESRNCQILLFHYKSMETLSYHSREKQLEIGNKNRN